MCHGLTQIGGYVLAPDTTTLFCAYASDGNSQEKVSKPLDQSARMHLHEPKISICRSARRSTVTRAAYLGVTLLARPVSTLVARMSAPTHPPTFVRRSRHRWSAKLATRLMCARRVSQHPPCMHALFLGSGVGTLCLYLVHIFYSTLFHPPLLPHSLPSYVSDWPSAERDGG